MINWNTATAPVTYPDALASMESHVDAMIAGTAAEKIWLLEHPSLYTSGTSADDAELLSPTQFPVYQTGRGGRYTYHGPGQRVAYVMADLRVRGKDVRAYVQHLEQWVIGALAEFGVTAAQRDGRIGLWVEHNGTEEKIAAIGVRIRKWVSYHGVAINVNPDLSHFAGIVPCGISSYGVTSLKKLGINASMVQLDDALKTSWDRVF